MTARKVERGNGQGVTEKGVEEMSEKASKREIHKREIDVLLALSLHNMYKCSLRSMYYYTTFAGK